MLDIKVALIKAKHQRKLVILVKLVILKAMNIPAQPPKSFRIVLNLERSESRMDTVLLNALRNQKEDLNMKNISRAQLKTYFVNGQVQIKGQIARPSSGLAKGTTYVDILLKAPAKEE